MLTLLIFPPTIADSFFFYFLVIIFQSLRFFGFDLFHLMADDLITTHYSILVWEVSWTEGRGGRQSLDSRTRLSTHTTSAPLVELVIAGQPLPAGHPGASTHSLTGSFPL